ncbi:MAG: hypothetical protein ACJA1A_000237 [Saprospiraceae bacterium]|jgi:hypothetical protein
MKQFFGIVLAAIIVISIGCNDGSLIGNDLLDNEAIELAYDDNFQLTAKTVRGDSVATFRVNLTSNTYLLGQIDEQVFGKYASDIYLGIAFGSSTPDFSESTIDSVVLELEYDSAGFYGDDNVVHNLEVFTVEEDWLDRDTIYSDESFATSMIPIGTKSFVPDFSGDSIRFQVRDTEVDSFITLSPRINIRLDDSYGQMLLADSAAAANDTSLVASFKGLYLKSTTDGNSIIGLNFVKGSSISTTIPKVAVYYTQQTSTGPTKRTYNYLLRNEVYSEFALDNTGSEVGNSLNDEIAGEEFLYAQGMSGINGEIGLPELSSLKGNLINSAQLVLTIADDENESYPFNRRFLLSKYDDGDRVLIEDIVKDGVNITTGLAILDGFPRKVLHEDGDSVTTVTFNITDFTRNVIESEEVSPRLVISPVGRTETPRRTVFYGSKHPKYPAKLRIAYTII